MFTTAYTNRCAWKSRRFLSRRSAWSRSTSGLSPTTSSYSSVFAILKVHHEQEDVASVGAPKPRSAFYRNAAAYSLRLNRACDIDAAGLEGALVSAQGKLTSPAGVVAESRVCARDSDATRAGHVDRKGGNRWHAGSLDTVGSGACPIIGI